MRKFSSSGAGSEYGYCSGARGRTTASFLPAALRRKEDTVGRPVPGRGYPDVRILTEEKIKLCVTGPGEMPGGSPSKKKIISQKGWLDFRPV